MQYPTNGRVVIVDDEIEEEAFPLIKALSRKGIAASFFTGRESELPDAPLGAVRLLFLDLKLEGIDFTQDSVDIARALKPVVERIIGPENGPYILFGWTKHPRHMKALEHELDIKPVLCLDMEKSDCKEGDDLDLDKINAKFDEKIAQIGHFKTIFEWENLVNDSAADTVNNIWTKDFDQSRIEAILFCIAEANLGKQISATSKEQKIKSGLQCFGYLLSDTIDNKLNFTDFSSLPELTQSSSLNQSLKSRINSKLLLGQSFNTDPYPSNVYLEFDSERKNQLKAFMRKRLNSDKIKKKFSDEPGNQNIKVEQKESIINQKVSEFENEILKEELMAFVEVTPVCDYAQKLHRCYRIIPCFLLKETICIEFMRTEQGGYFYLSPPLFLDSYSDSFILVLNYRGFVTLDLSVLNAKTPLFRLGKELLFDIQHKAGYHFGRPGFVYLPLTSD